MSDVLTTYKESKDALLEITRSILIILEQNDTFSLLNQLDVNFIDIVETEVDETVNICLMSFSDNTPRLIFPLSRSIVLALDEERLVEEWYNASLLHIERMNIIIAKRFLKDYQFSTHDLIKVIVSNYAKLSKDHSDVKIAELSAKAITNYLKNS